MVTTERKLRKQRKQQVSEALQHPGVRILINELRRTSKEFLFEYDKTSDLERLRQIRVSRWFINEELPRVVESIMNEERDAGGWSFRDFISGLYRKRR